MTCICGHPEDSHQEDQPEGVVLLCLADGCRCKDYRPKSKIECKTCDYGNAIRYGRADWRCPRCGRQLMLEIVLMYDVGINPSEIKPEWTKTKTTKRSAH